MTSALILPNTEPHTEPVSNLQLSVSSIRGRFWAVVSFRHRPIFILIGVGQISSIRAALAHVELTLNQSRFSAGLRNAERDLARSAANMRQKGLAILQLGGALATPFVAAITQASRMEETMAKFQVVFGDASDEVKDWSDVFAKEVGRSRQQIADFMASSQDLFIPLGFDKETATDLSKTITGLSVDLASFNNKSDADVQRDLQAALTGSGEVMKKYGVIVSEAAVKQELLNSAINPSLASNQQKVQARLNIILKGTTAAQGDAVRSGKSLANSWKRLQATILDTFESIGAPLLSITSDLVNHISGVIAIIGDWIQENKQLVKIAAGVVAGIIGVGVAVYGAGVAMSVVSTAIGVVNGAFGLLTTVMGAVATIGGVVASAIAFIASPLGLVTAALAIGVGYFFAYTEAGKSVVDWFTGNFGKLFEIVQQTVGGMYDALSTGDLATAAEIAFTGVKLAIGGLMDEIETIFGVSFESMFKVIAQFTKAIAVALAKLNIARQSAVNFIAEGLAGASDAVFGGDLQKAVQEDNQRALKRAQATRDSVNEFDAGGFAKNARDTFDTDKSKAEFDRLTKKARDKKEIAFSGLETDDIKKTSINPADVNFNPKEFSNAIGAGQKKITSVGSFSGAVAGRQGSGKPIDRLVKLVEKQTKSNEKRDREKIKLDKERNTLLQPANGKKTVTV